MAAPFARLEVWSDVAAAAGTRLAFIPDLISLKEERTLDGQDRITTELRRESDAWGQLRKERVLRVVFDDGTFDEWRISSIEEADKAGPLTGTVVAVSPLMDLARGFLERTEADGTAWPVFELLGLTPSTLISSVILPAAPSYFALGTVNPTATVDMTFEADTPLSALRALAQLTESELAIRRNGTTNYLVDLLTAVGSGATVTHLRLGKNVRGVSHQVLPDDHATRIYGVGGGEEDIRLTIAGARWKITAITGLDLTLADPAGADAPLAYDDQLNGFYLRKEGAASSTLINDSVQSTQKVTVASTAGLAVNDTVAIEKNSAGADLIYLEAPADKVTYGLVVGILARPNLPNVRNFVANPQLNGTYAAGLPSNWAKVGAPTTAEETASLFTRYGGKSCKVTATADGQGIETAAITIAPTADSPHFSGFATFQIASGKVRFEIVDITNDKTYPDPAIAKALSSELNVWVDPGAAGLDFQAVSATSLKLRILADGGAATFYVDAAQLSQTAGQIPFFAGVGATQLWQAVNDELVKRSVPKESLDVDLIDLHRYDPTAWPYEELVLGGTVKIVHGDLGLDRSTRIVSWSRDLILPMVTDVRLSNRSEDLTEAAVRPDRRPRLRRAPDESDPYRGQRVSLGSPSSVVTDTSVKITVTPSVQVSKWRLHLVQGASLASADCDQSNLIGERLNDSALSNYDNLTAISLNLGTQYAWRAIPYNRDGVRVTSAEVTGMASTTGAIPWQLSAFTVTGIGSGAAATDQLRWSHSTTAMPGTYAVDIDVDTDGDGVYETTVQTGRDPRCDADGTDCIDASGDGGKDFTVDVTASVSVTWMYRLRLKDGATLKQTLGRKITRTYKLLPI